MKMTKEKVLVNPYSSSIPLNQEQIKEVKQFDILALKQIFKSLGLSSSDDTDTFEPAINWYITKITISGYIASSGDVTFRALKVYPSGSADTFISLPRLRFDTNGTTIMNVFYDINFEHPFLIEKDQYLQVDLINEGAGDVIHVKVFGFEAPNY